VVTLTGTQTLTNKTLTAPVLASANITTALTLTGAAGTSGQVLTSAGGGAPTWASPAPAANGLVWLSTVTASNSATVDIENTFNSTYKSYLLVVSGATFADNNVVTHLRLKLGGSYITSSTYIYHSNQSSSAGSIYNGLGASSSAPQGAITLSNMGNGAANSMNLVMNIFNPDSTALTKNVSWVGSTIRSEITTCNGVGTNTGTGALTGLRFYAATGNILAGTFRLYGIANS